MTNANLDLKKYSQAAHLIQVLSRYIATVVIELIVVFEHVHSTIIFSLVEMYGTLSST